jgi:NitT/TauT family transport system substrate-binding protein
VIARRRFVGLAAAALAGVPRAGAAQARTLTIGYVPSTLFAPVFVAQESGYLRDAGFNANLTPIVAGQDAMALVAQGQIDCVAAGLSAAFFNAVNRNLEVKFVASTGYQPKIGHPTALMMRQDLYDAGAHDAGALRGKRIGWLGGAGATAGYYVARILRKYQLRMGDIEPVNIAAPDQEVALERKAVDAMFASAPFTAVFAQRHLATVCDTVPAGISGTGIFFGPTLLRDIAGAGALMGGLRRGAAAVSGVGYYSATNLAAMAKYVNQPAALIRTTDRYDFKPDLRIDLATLLDMQREFLAQKILAYQTPLNEVRLVARF